MAAANPPMAEKPSLPKRSRTKDPQTKGHVFKRLAWFVALWFAGVATVGAVGLLIKLVLAP